MSKHPNKLSTYRHRRTLVTAIQNPSLPNPIFVYFFCSFIFSAAASALSIRNLSLQLHQAAQWHRRRIRPHLRRRSQQSLVEGSRRRRSGARESKRRR